MATQKPSNFTVIVTVDVKEDRRDEFFEVMKVDAVDSRNTELDPGCKRFDLVESRDTPNRFYFYEAYVDEAAAAEHKKTAHYDKWAKFKASGGATSEAVKAESVSVGDWALQANDSPTSQFTAGVIITIDIALDRVDEFLQVIGEDTRTTRTKLLEPGNLRVDILRSTENRSRFYFYEIFIDDETCANHKTTPHYDVWKQFKTSGGVTHQVTERIKSVMHWGFTSASTPVGCTEMPLLGFGLYKVGAVPPSASGAGSEPVAGGPEVCAKVVHDALTSAYTMFDCAEFYSNEAWVGDALKSAKTPRNCLYLISKVWNTTIYEGPDAVKKQVDKAIADLKCEYIDMMLVHWPVPGKHVAAYNALRECKAAGKVKEIGLSNYCIEDYEELRAAGAFGKDGEDKPRCNQIEVNPALFRKKTIDFFQKEGVHIQAYRGLMQGAAAWAACAPLQEVCKETGRPAAQVLGRFLVQQGISHVPKASAPERMLENRDLFTFELSKSQVERLSQVPTPEAIENFKKLYTKCIWRDTPEEGGAMLGSRTLD